MKKSTIFLLLMLFVLAVYGQEESTDSTYIHKTSSAPPSSTNLIEFDEAPSHDRSRTLEALRGQFSGLDINASSGSPGASISAVLRGYNSVVNSNHPLIVLDGMIINNDEFNATNTGVDQSNRLMDINTYDIESINVLKGSVGSAKYGIRGSNGVLEIISKFAKENKLTVDFSTAVSTSKANQLIALQNRYAQGERNLYRGPETFEAESWGPLISSLEYNGDSSYPFDYRGRLVSRGQGNGTPAEAYDPYTFLTDAISHDHNLSVGKSGETFGFRISAGLNNHNGIIPTTFNKRYSGSANIMANLSDKLTINTGFRYVQNNAYRNNRGSNLSGIMLGLTRTSPSFDNANGLSPKDALNDESAYILPNGNQRSYRNGIYDNPYWSITKNQNSNKTNRTIGNLSVNYKLNKNIKIHLLSGIDTYTETQTGGKAKNPQSLIEASAYQNSRNFSSSYHKASLAYKISPNEKWMINNEIGFDLFFSNSINEFINGDVSAGQPIDISNVPTRFIQDTQSKKATYGVYLNSNITWNKFINVQVVARYDKSSALGKNNDGLLSYGLNTEIDILNISNNNINPASNPNQLYFSFGIGRSANDLSGSLNRRTFNPLEITGDPFISTTSFIGTFEVSDFAINDNLSAEKTDALEFGIRTTNWKNRFSLGAKYYNETTKDAIRYIDIDKTSGFSFMLFNDYSISNKGFEIDIWGKILQHKSIEWILSGSITKNINKVTQSNFGNNETTLSRLGQSRNTQVIVDQPYGVLVGDQFGRNIQSQLIIDADGFPIIDRTQGVIGNPAPDFIVNINNEIRFFTNVSVQGLLEIRSGGDVWCGTCGVLNAFGRTELAANERNKLFLFEGVNASGTPNATEVNLADPKASPQEHYRARYGFAGLDEMNIHKASWIRLRTLSIQYDLKPKALKFIQTMRIGLFANNLFLITDYPGMDPESNLSGAGNGRGLQYFNNPSTKSFGINLNAQF